MFITDSNKLKMGQKKKIKNKQNFMPIKKTTIQQINYTQQLHIPTFNTIELKNLGKSIQLSKQTSNKKPLSRKSKCISVKQTCTSVKQTCTSAKQSTTQPIKYKQLLKRFQQLKGLQERAQRSKSRSAKSIRDAKSKSPVSHMKTRQNSKKFNLTALMNKNFNKPVNKTEFNSRMSLTNKLQKTLKKINQDEYFCRDEDDSLIPFVSTSEAGQNQEYANKKSYQITNEDYQDEDFVNILEMRKFCKTKESEDFLESTFKRNINYFRGDQYEMMATKIQRAWRRYRTKKIVDRYADVFSNHHIHQVLSQEQESSDQNEISSRSGTSSSELNYHDLDLNLDFPNSQFSKMIQMKNEIQSYSQDQGKTFQSQQKSIQAQSCQQNDSNEKLFESQKLYKDNMVQDQRLITYISNLEDQEQLNKYEGKLQKNDSVNEQKSTLVNNLPLKKEQELKIQQGDRIPNEQCDMIISEMKKMQLEKWKQVVELLEMSKKKKNPLQLQNLLLKLQQKSSRNKKQLQEIQKQQLLSSSSRKQQPIKTQKTEQYQKFGLKRQESGPSDTSDLKKQEEFDSRKYIQYLDSDMFLMQKDKSSQNSELLNDERLGRRISKRKQKQLLAILDIGEAPLRLKSHCFSKSQNLSYLIDDQQTPYMPPVNSHRLSKSISQKNIEKVIKSLSPQLKFLNDEKQQDQMNLDLIRQQFLQSADPIQQLQKLHTNQELKQKIKQSLDQQENSNFDEQSYQEEPTHPARINIDLTKTFNIQTEYLQNFDISSETNNKINLQPQKQQRITQINNVRNNQLPKPVVNSVIVIENTDKNIEDDEKNSVSSEEDSQKLENISFMVYNSLILEVLREIASYDSLLERFKDYSLSVKSQQKQGKKGFQTNHNEVKSYVEGLITFLLNQEPQVFKNLEISAGPSALQMLHYMHPSQGDDEGQDDSNISQDESSVMVIPNRMFDKYWSLRQKGLKFEIENATYLSQQRKKKIVEDLKNLTKVFYRSIFDTFNECLDIQRNYGQAGKPYPWKKTPHFHHTKDLTHIQKSIQTSQKRMTQIATTYCGLIIEKNEMAKISMQGSDDYIQHVQQDRMSRMLAQDLIEGEERWTFYDDQELELLVQIGNFITISLVLEAGEEICAVLKV